MMLICTVVAFVPAIALISPVVATGQPPEVQYLSGTGNDNTVDWEFMVDGGQRAIGTKILPAHEHGPEGNPGVAFRGPGTFDASLYFRLGGE